MSLAAVESIERQRGGGPDHNGRLAQPRWTLKGFETRTQEERPSMRERVISCGAKSLKNASMMDRITEVNWMGMSVLGYSVIYRNRICGYLSVN